MNRGLRAIVGQAAIFLVLYVISLLVEPFYELEGLELLAFRTINHVITAAVMITLLWYCGRIMTRINTAWGEEEIIDHATGLYNRQYVYQLIHTAGEDHRVNGTNYAIVITDIDQLKKINENYGYAIGDKVVLRVAEILKDTKTADNVTGIWDNGKFVTLLKFRGTLESLYLMIQEMNRKIGMSEIMLEDGKPIYATATIGIGTLKSELTTDEVIRRTEERVASGKKQGGDRVIWGNLLK